jgi:hypothetical protein
MAESVSGPSELRQPPGPHAGLAPGGANSATESSPARSAVTALSPEAVDETSRMLWALLSKHPEHRIRWSQRGRPARSTRPECAGALNYAAISDVVSDWVIDNEHHLDKLPTPRSLKDRVRRALTGTLLEPRTLRWLTEAFEMDHEETKRLFTTLHGYDTAGGWWPQEWQTLPVSGHRTRLLSEHHVVGADRRPAWHHTVQVIEAEAEELTAYPFIFDTPEAIVVVDEGGLAGPVHQVRDDLWCCSLNLTTPLPRGRTTSLSYSSRFRYQEIPAPEFRRGARRRVDSVSLTVRFHPDAVPQSVQWGRWDATDHLTETEDVDLVDLVAHRFLDGLEDAVVGFRWQW